MDRIAINSQVYSITSENEIAVILSRFNSDFVFDIIKDTLANKFTNCVFNIPGPNVVAAFEQNFKNLKELHPADSQNIENVRVETYKEIISVLCKEYNLEFIDTGECDYYSIAFYLYDFLAGNFSTHLVEFFTNYIIKEKNSIYDLLNMDSFKKNKDVTTLYNKKLFKDSKLAVISANLENVIRNMAQFDFDMYSILQQVYPIKLVVNGLASCVQQRDDFYKNYYWGAFKDHYVAPVLITNIKLQIQSIQTAEGGNQ